MIVDARLASYDFDEPDSVELATGQAFSTVRADEGPPIIVGGVDIQVAFYAMLLPRDLRTHFGLAPVRAGMVNVTSVDG